MNREAPTLQRQCLFTAICGRKSNVAVSRNTVKQGISLTVAFTSAERGERYIGD